MDCLFCKIVDRTIPSSIVFEDNDILGFEDIHPQTPHHILIIPKQHIATLNDLQDNNAPLIGRMILVAKQLAQKLSIAEEGYRLVFNTNRQGGQEIYHVHLHLLAGRQMHWPPG